MASNFKIKMSGQKLTLKKYSKAVQFNYATKHVMRTPKGESDHSREHFYKAIARARNRIFDIVSCNINVIPDYEGNVQKPKFLTLTFAENITDVKAANGEFTLFNKRLSYYLYQEQKNVLKYVCIPEFQKRGAIHFHVLYFNLPYVDIKKISQIWGQGYAFIEGIKETQNIEDFAKYVCKYMNKHNSKGEDNYQIYLDKEMLNQKRYFASRGLNRPEEYKLEIDKELYHTFLTYLENEHVESHEIENEFVGKIEINTYEVTENTKKNIRNVVKAIFNAMSLIYGKIVKIDLKTIIGYMKIDENLYYEQLETIFKAKEWYHDNFGKSNGFILDGPAA